ncbi:MAG: hypothetical protein AAB574_02750 [Patescibacteria group bacterium]
MLPITIDNLFYLAFKKKVGGKPVATEGDLMGCEVVESKPGALREMTVTGQDGLPVRRIVVMSGSDPQ